MERIIAAVEIGGAHVEKTFVLNVVNNHKSGTVSVGQEAELGVDGDTTNLRRSLAIHPGSEADQVRLETSGLLQLARANLKHGENDDGTGQSTELNNTGVF